MKVNGFYFDLLIIIFNSRPADELSEAVKATTRRQHPLWFPRLQRSPVFAPQGCRVDFLHDLELFSWVCPRLFSPGDENDCEVKQSNLFWSKGNKSGGNTAVFRAARDFAICFSLACRHLQYVCVANTGFLLVFIRNGTIRVMNNTLMYE